MFRATMRGQRRRALLGTALLSVSALSLTALSGTTSAAVSACRSDPSVVLSNGKTVVLYTDIHDSLSDIKSAAYVLHGPKNTSVVSVTYSGALPASEESFTYYADNAAGSYDGYTTISTGTTVPVTAYESAGAVQGYSQSGYSNKTIHTRVVSP